MALPVWLASTPKLSVQVVFFLCVPLSGIVRVDPTCCVPAATVGQPLPPAITGVAPSQVKPVGRSSTTDSAVTSPRPLAESSTTL